MAQLWGVTPTGFVRKPLAQIIADLKAQYQAQFGENIDLSDDGPFGQQIALGSVDIDEAWQLAEAVYDSSDRDSAEGPRLVSIGAITGTLPKTPTPSTVTITATGTAASVIPAGTRFQVAGQGPLFETLADATIGVGGTVDIPCASVDNGAIIAAAGTLTVIATPRAGLLSVTNAADAVLGQAKETDAQFRLRQVQELQLGGQGSVNAIRAALLEVAGVTAAKVLQNKTMAVDGNGLPPKSIKAVVLGGADADVAKAVFTVGAGIETVGDVTVNVADLAGELNPISFSRPTALNIYVIVHIKLETDATQPQFPSDGDTQIKKAIVDFAQGNLPYFRGYGVGDSVVTSKLYRPIEGVDGINDVTEILIGTAPAPTTSANIAIGATERAVFDVSRITIVHD